MTHKKNLMKNSINLSKMISRSLEPLPFLISTGGGFHRMKGAPGGAGGRRSFFCPSRFLRCLFNGEWVISGAKNRACISRKKKETASSHEPQLADGAQKNAVVRLMKTISQSN